MAYERDTAVIVIEEAEDGFSAKYFLWTTSPPPLPNGLDRYLSLSSPAPAQQTRISADKATLNTEIAAFVNSFLAMP